MLILSLFILQALSSLYCYDPELDGVMKVGINSLGKDSKPNRNFLPFNFMSSNRVSKKHAEEDPEVAKAIQEAQLARLKISFTVQQFIIYLQAKAKLILQNMGTQILTDLNIKKNITSMLETVTDDFGMMIQNYYDFMSADRTNSLMDRDLIYLDLVETSGRLLYSEGKALLQEIISAQNLSNQTKSIELLNDKILKSCLDVKKEEMNYVCETYSICKDYHAFTDYVANLISEIIKLPDAKFRKFLEILISVLKNYEEFFASVSEKEDREILTAGLHPLSKDLVTLKEYFVVVREVIIKKFKADLNGDEEFKVKAKAMMVLLDIIDKALSTEEDLLTTDLENSLIAIQSWGRGEDKEMKSTCETFVKRVMKILDYNLTKNARREMSILIKAIVRGAADDHQMILDLLVFGSKYVQGEDLPLDMGVF